ncbi:MAG TPA: SDR family NAD(P)-dependent oxidoreductase, partial [Pyrinomonadaceae bacterium]|nr:SDR family NAD(P)-dependent oxidoreductase [Pyrinomonadaceae bacterium]
SLLFLAQALDEFKIDQELDLTVVSDSVQDVTGEESLSPERATVLGPCRVLPQEYPNITCRSIDVLLHKSKGPQQKLVRQVIAEILARSSDSFVAYRGQHRWTQSFEPLPVAAPGDGELRLIEGGLYLITGGVNDLNLDLAELLARAAGAKVVLAGACDEANQWAEKLKEIETAGGEVVLANVDTADAQQLWEIVNDAQQRCGPLKGIFFNANTAVANPTSIRALDAGKCSVHLRQITHELAALESLTEQSELDFCVLLSSLSTIVGGRAEIASVAANHIVDAFAHAQKQKARGCWMSLNLDLKHLRNGADSQPDLIITREQAAEVFRRSLSLNTISQVAVSTIDLRERLAREKATGESTKIAENKSQSSTHSRPNLSSKYVAPRNEVEHSIARMYEELLGITPIGVHDDFFELGGHSLVGIQLTFRIRETYDLEDFHMNTLFEKPTPAGLAESVEEIRRTGLTMPPILVPIQPQGSNPPFFCVHPVGGDVYGLVPLGRNMLPDQPFYGIQSMGLAHYGEYEDYQTLEQMAADYIKAIRF